MKKKYDQKWLNRTAWKLTFFVVASVILMYVIIQL